MTRVEVFSAAPAAEDVRAMRSRQNLRGGLCALKQGDSNAAEVFMIALEREGDGLDYAALARAFIAEAAR